MVRWIGKALTVALAAAAGVGLMTPEVYAGGSQRMVHTQAELNAALADAEAVTDIQVVPSEDVTISKSPTNPKVSISTYRENQPPLEKRVTVEGDVRITASGDSRVVARDNAHVAASGTTDVVAF